MEAAREQCHVSPPQVIFMDVQEFFKLLYMLTGVLQANALSTRVLYDLGNSLMV